MYIIEIKLKKSDEKVKKLMLDKSFFPTKSTKFVTFATWVAIM
jgi:hypothetical protein